MIEKTFYVALAANWLMQNPLWQRATESRKTQDNMIDLLDGKSWDYKPGDETNWFHRKPFTCLYCITFWLALLCCVVVPMLGLGAVEPGVCFTAPVVALAFSRWYNSLPVKF